MYWHTERGRLEPGKIFGEYMCVADEMPFVWKKAFRKLNCVKREVSFLVWYNVLKYKIVANYLEERLWGKLRGVLAKGISTFRWPEPAESSLPPVWSSFFVILLLLFHPLKTLPPALVPTHTQSPIDCWMPSTLKLAYSHAKQIVLNELMNAFNFQWLSINLWMKVKVFTMTCKSWVDLATVPALTCLLICPPPDSLICFSSPGLCAAPQVSQVYSYFRALCVLIPLPGMLPRPDKASFSPLSLLSEVFYALSSVSDVCCYITNHPTNLHC